MSDTTPQDPPANEPDVLQLDVDAEQEADADEMVNDGPPLDPAGPTELGDAVDK